MATEVYTVSHLRAYPLKSGGELALSEAWINSEGLESIDGVVKDHEYFAVRAKPDSKGIHHFVTQRSHELPDEPKARKEHFRSLALVKPSVDNRGQVWGWGSTDKQQVKVSRPYDEGEVRRIQLWDFEGEAVEVPHLTEWIQGVSGYDLRIMRTSGPWDRPVRQNYIKNSNKLRAQDGYPIHAILETDADAVSAHAGQEIPWNRYRPQIVLTGGEPWSLHDIFEGVLEDVKITQSKPCGRCPMPGYDQELGIPSPLKPIAHVDKMRPRWINRRGEEEIIFGENWIMNGSAIIKVGSELKPTSYRVSPNPVLQFASK